MTKNKIMISAVSIATGLSFLVGFTALPASAQTASTTAANQAARLTKIITRSDKEITARITALNNLSSRIQAMKNVSATEKNSVSNEVQTNIAGLTTLKVKIDADTDVVTATADEKSVFGTFRIYALVVPQGYIESSVDRIDTISGMMTTIAGKLQARITEAQSAGKDVTALNTALGDLNARVADAKVQAQTAQSGVANLVPDNGNTTQAASNHTALVAARANIKTATSDFQTARKDANTIAQALKAFHLPATASSTTSQ